MKIVFLGPPGAGKGTCASRVAPKLGIPHISTGNLFRNNVKENTQIGAEAKKYMDEGKLVPDEVVMGMVEERIKEDDCKEGFILDGVPRTVNQAKILDGMTKIDYVINLSITDEMVVARNSARISCSQCEKIYNTRTLPPKVDGVCDDCGGELIRRKDDEPDVIKDRLDVYRKETEPLIDFYDKKGLLNNIEIERIDDPPEVVVEEVLELVNG